MSSAIRPIIFQPTVAHSYWPVLGFSLLGLALVMMPRPVFRRLQLFGLVSAVLTILSNVLAFHLKTWRFSHQNLAFFTVPFGFILGWYAAALIYGYLLLKYSFLRGVIILGMSAATVFVEYLAVLRRVVHFGPHWSLVESFFLAIIYHVVLAYAFHWLINPLSRETFP
ncbi:MAG: hypothetical protein ACM3XS_01775 [Bacteroidota bacterium]